MKRIWLLIMMLTALTLSAQEFDFDDEVSGDDSFSDSFGDDLLSNGDGLPLEISGSLKIPFTLTPQWGSLGTLKNSAWDGEALLTTDLDYAAPKADLHASLEALWKEGELEPALDEAYVRIYMGDADLEMGLRKITWGKGDGVHVMDNLNPMDYTDFIEPDYNDRKLADLMLRLNLPSGDVGRLELVFLPWFTPDTHAMEGDWMQQDVKAVEQFLEVYGINYFAADPTGTGNAVLNTIATNQRLVEAEETFFREEDTTSLKYAQGGFRFTQTLGPLDWGIAVVRTYMRDLAFKAVDLGLASVLTDDPHIDVSYTPMYLLAEEAGLVIGPYNFRLEGAYSLTEDLEGDDPDLKNPRMDWLFGFDRNLPISNMNINIQGKGQYILLSDQIASTEMDYSDRYYSHMLIVSLTDSWFHETLDITLAGSWNIEDKDYLFRPQLDYHFKESATLGLGYRLYEGEADTLYGQFDDLDRLIISMEMSF